MTWSGFKLPFGIFFKLFWYLRIYVFFFYNIIIINSNVAFVIFWLSICYFLITPLLSYDYLFFIFWLPLWNLLIVYLGLRDCCLTSTHQFFNYMMVNFQLVDDKARFGFLLCLHTETAYNQYLLFLLNAHARSR